MQVQARAHLIQTGDEFVVKIAITKKSLKKKQEKKKMKNNARI